jgi:hypothetical protein
VSDRTAEQAVAEVLTAWTSWRGGRKTPYDKAMITVGDLLLEHGLVELEADTEKSSVSTAGMELLRESTPTGWDEASWHEFMVRLLAMPSSAPLAGAVPPAAGGASAPARILPIGHSPWTEELHAKVAQLVRVFGASDPLTHDIEAGLVAVRILAEVQRALDAAPPAPPSPPHLLLLGQRDPADNGVYTIVGLARTGTGTAPVIVAVVNSPIDLTAMGDR